MTPEEQAERDQLAHVLDTLIALCGAFDSESPLLRAMPLPSDSKRANKAPRDPLIREIAA